MIIEIDGYSLKLLDSFLYYSLTYPGRIADAMWWCEDSFILAAQKLKKAFDAAVYDDNIHKFHFGLE